MKALYKVMKGHGLNFIFTTHLNQDCLENLFSRLRALTGNNQHPSPVECLRRLRILMIGKNRDIVLSHPSVELERDTSKEDSSSNSDFFSKVTSQMSLLTLMTIAVHKLHMRWNIRKLRNDSEMEKSQPESHLELFQASQIVLSLCLTYVCSHHSNSQAYALFLSIPFSVLNKRSQRTHVSWLSDW